MDSMVTCKAVAAGAGTAVALECGQVFLGIPREVLYAAMAGACAGLAQRPRGDWEGFLAPSKFGRTYVLVAARGGWLAFTLAANALICAWIAQLLQYLPLANGVAQALPMGVAGVLGWMSQRMLPALADAVSDGIRTWVNRKAGGQ